MSGVLSDLSRRVRKAESDRELGFVLVNDSLAISPYRQAALWLADGGTWCLSGVVQVDANVPYVMWLNAVARHLHSQATTNVRTFSAGDLPDELAAEWAHWWPEHAVWLGSSATDMSGAGILARESPWTANEQSALQEWAEIWWHAFAALHRPRLARLKSWRHRLGRGLQWQTDQAWWRQRRLLILAALLALMFMPVRLTVLAPGELVPAKPLVIRAPLDGVIDVFHVQPNQQVRADQALFSFDEIVIQSRLGVAIQALATAETDYRQTSQMALSDNKSKVQLGLLVGKIEEREAEIEYLKEQLARSRVLAPQAGVVLMDDPAEWIGRPVSTGERILRIATLDDVEVEAWLPLADAIHLTVGDEVMLYLSASPLKPVTATLRYMAHEAVQRPDSSFAYRVRAALSGPTDYRVGLKGTAKLHGDWVPLAFWVMRRPWATLRAYVGW
jgi:multidrug resistance efflux pump